MSKQLHKGVTTLYDCAPEKNTACSKAGCFKNGGPCSLTSNPNFANETGKVRLVLPKEFAEEVLEDLACTENKN